MLSLHVHETIMFCRMVNSHFPMVKLPVPYISSSKTQSVDLFCFSILMYFSVQILVLYSQRLTSSILDLFLSKAQKQDSARKLRFYFDQMFHKC